MTAGPSPLATRPGPKPKTTPTNPHVQLDQNAPAELQELLWRLMSGLAHVETGPSLVSVPGARATSLVEGCGCGPDGACMIGREFAHLHPADDGSLHLTLPRALRTDAIAKGWAEPHALVGTGRVPDTVVMVYGPRTADELETVWSLVQASHRFALGSPAG